MIPKYDPAQRTALYREVAETAREYGVVDDPPQCFGPVTCMACGHEHVGAWHASQDGKLVQCPKCRTMSGRGRAFVVG